MRKSDGVRGYERVGYEGVGYEGVGCEGVGCDRGPGCGCGGHAV